MIRCARRCLWLMIFSITSLPSVMVTSLILLRHLRQARDTLMVKICHENRYGRKQREEMLATTRRVWRRCRSAYGYATRSMSPTATHRRHAVTNATSRCSPRRRHYTTVNIPSPYNTASQERRSITPLNGDVTRGRAAYGIGMATRQSCRRWPRHIRWHVSGTAVIGALFEMPR